MDDTERLTKTSRVLLTAACFVVVVAGMRAASDILVPFILSLFIAMICTPFLNELQKRKIPNGLAVIIIVIFIITLGVFLLAFLGRSINGLTRDLPMYQNRINAQINAVIAWLSNIGIDISGEVIKEYFNPGRAFRMAAGTLSRLSGVLTNSFMILLTVIFIMLEASGFPLKLYAALKNPEQSLERFHTISESINRYMVIKTITSLSTGMIIGIWLWVLGVDYALLWALLAFLLNFVPNIGSIIAAIPAVLLAMVQYGLGKALVAALGYVAVNVVIGSLIEPRYMGRGLGLSTLVVFLSLIFWGWVLGPIGMLLSVPLTMILKIALETHDHTRWISVILGTGPPKGEDPAMEH